MPTKARLAAIQRVQEIYLKLEQQSLVHDELEELVTITTSLHESALILRYKAAEERVFENDKKAKNSVELVRETKEEKVEINNTVAIQENPPSQSVAPEIDFTIFDEQPTDRVTTKEPVEEKVVAFVEEETNEQPETNETTEEPKTVVPPISVEDTSKWSGYFAKVIADHASGLQTPLHALAGSFGLNERILYINELFNGEAEKFSEAIQSLDKLPNWPSAAEKLAELGKLNDWDKQNDVTGEFIVHVKRKYA